MRVEIADVVYARVRDLFEQGPELFSMTRDGLVLPLSVTDEYVVGDAITLSIAVTSGLRDRWLLRATREHWVLLPLAFGIEDDELPAYLQDRRGKSEQSLGATG